MYIRRDERINPFTATFKMSNISTTASCDADLFICLFSYPFSERDEPEGEKRDGRPIQESSEAMVRVLVNYEPVPLILNYWTSLHVYLYNSVIIIFSGQRFCKKSTRRRQTIITLAKMKSQH